MKRIVLLCLLTALCLPFKAQTYFGLKGGVNLPRLYYTNPNLRNLPHKFMYGHSAGFFVEFPVWNQLALAPELNVQKRGGATSYQYLNQYDVSYQLQAYYVNLRIPACWYFGENEILKPYLLVGPDAGYVVTNIGSIPLGGIILEQKGLMPKKEVAINDSNIRRLYVGALAGAGVRLNINIAKIIFVVKLDAALNWGFIDTFSPDEKVESAHATNVYAYNHQGVRMSRGLEAHLSLGCIFKAGMKDACGNFQNTYKRKKVSYLW